MGHWPKMLLSGGVTLLLAVTSSADLREDLTELKELCDQGLLTEGECKAQRQLILDRYNAAQDQTEGPSWFCNYAGEAHAPGEFDPETLSFAETSSASAAVKEILDAAGLAPNFIVRPAPVPNAAARQHMQQRYIEYNPSFVAQLKNQSGSNWAVYSVLAHEIGHHLQGHTIQAGGSRPAIEIEADEYSGFILRRLGANLEQAQSAMRTFGSDSSSGTHPPQHDRLEAIQRGWEKRPSRGPTPIPNPDQDYPLPPPTPQATYTDECVIQGQRLVIRTDGAVVQPNLGFMQVAKRIPGRQPPCQFEIHTQYGWYCIHRDGYAYFGGPQPVANADLVAQACVVAIKACDVEKAMAVSPVLKLLRGE